MSTATNNLRLVEGLASILNQLDSEWKPLNFLGVPYISVDSFTCQQNDITRHVGCTRMPGDISNNPYNISFFGETNGFHITFYEMVDPSQYCPKVSSWKIGKLFDDDLVKGHYLRESAITVCRPLIQSQMIYAKQAKDLFTRGVRWRPLPCS